MILFLSLAFVLLFVVLCFVCHREHVSTQRLTGNIEQVLGQLESVRTDRDHHLAEIEKQKKEQDLRLHNVRKELEGKLHEKDARVQKIVSENSDLQWRQNPRDREAYTVTVTVNPQMFGGYGSRMDRDDLQYIARYLGEQVAHDLASYKYIQKARETEEQYQARTRRPYTF